jgi:hypothetical protein
MLCVADSLDHEHSYNVGCIQVIEESAHKIHMCPGSCSINGCPCKGYVQSYGTDLCGNCGHNYTVHW